MPRRTRRSTATVALVLALLPAGPATAAPPPTDPAATAPATDARVTGAPAAAATEADTLRAAHALGRLAFGPRPGDVERVRRLGVEVWIEQQLAPERVADERLAERLAGLRTIALPGSELLAKYELPPQARRQVQQAEAERARQGMEGEAARRAARAEVVSRYGLELEGTPRLVIEELQAAKLIRATHSERQLEEVLVDFWMNHFNVFAQKGPVRMLAGEYEREAIRKNAWGAFERLLLATAQSPAMLFYLDNWMSVDPEAARRREERLARRQARGFGPTRPGSEGAAPGRPEAGAGRRPIGINENYARELLELHTLGVDGGYTQKDVTEVARCFTGWTIEGLRENRPRFAFNERMHDTGDKLVLGIRIRGGGREEGEQVIRMLAAHPATARHVSTKLARRLVADEPAPALVERAAATFREKGGDTREVLRTIVRSPEFWQSAGAKVKTPLEFVVSAIRASGAEVEGAREINRRLAEMGMPLYLQQAPTGYKDTADAWLSTSGLLARLNFGLDLAAGRIRGVQADVTRLAPAAGDAAALASSLAASLLPAGLSAATRSVVDQKAGTGLDAARVAGLLLGSPEFQRR